MVQGTIVGLQLSTHDIGVAIELVLTTDDGLCVGLAALNVIPSEEVARIVLTERDD